MQLFGNSGELNFRLAIYTFYFVLAIVSISISGHCWAWEILYCRGEKLLYKPGYY